ncbi:MAG: hypothetical protein KC419_00075 [Anaerolineales bacterium]|nr:hypothetical protein [Anaerolineales bacterium]MCA9926829.1 hypothetical protein [Anaerolineales bacterium]
MSAEEKEEKAKAPAGIGRFLRSEVLIGSLVALLSILTALIGYRASVVDSLSNDHTLNAQRTLSEANREYLDAGQKVMQDFISYDNYYAVSNSEATENYYASFSDALVENLEDPDRDLFDDLYYESLLASDTGIFDVSQIVLLDIISYDNYYASTNLDAADNYYASFSEALIANLDDPDREFLFDEQYDEEMFGFSGTCFAEADGLFELGQEVGGVADRYQLVMFVFAIGLAMAAWASLLDETGKMRIAFVFFALAMLAYGTLLYLGIAAEASEILSAPVDMSCLQALTGQ